uniref:Uncharacterized protein n=1 Tax=Oryza glumipatula TaxID=40148 RepID=A0A0D9ZR91_9ORYZ
MRPDLTQSRAAAAAGGTGAAPRGGRRASGCGHGHGRRARVGWRQRGCCHAREQTASTGSIWGSSGCSGGRHGSRLRGEDGGPHGVTSRGAKLPVAGATVPPRREPLEAKG